jgi:hypothetical protein
LASGLIPPTAGSAERRRRLGGDLLLLTALLASGWLSTSLALRHARPALMNLGPNDAEYVEGFREDWERDRLTRFHWTTLSAAVRLPVHAQGSGHLLRMRVRRHFLEPARITLKVEGRTAATFDIVADTRVPYRVLEIPLPTLDGRAPFRLEILASSINPRPLGVAIDWLEIKRSSVNGSFYLNRNFSLFQALLIAAAYLLPRWAGSTRAVSAIHAGLVLGSIAVGTAWDVLAAERILRLGTAAYIGTGLLALALVSWSRARKGLDIDTDAPHGREAAGVLVVIVLCAIAFRLALLLHPQFYYPDVRVHALFAWQLARQGLVRFLEEFTANQFRYSLGLQFENGHWYAFPYPPVFYILTWPFIRLAQFRPEVAVSLLGAVVNSLEALVVFGIARRLGRHTVVALVAAGAVPLLPIFIVRLGLAYFPALVGHAVDAVLILYLLSRLSSLDRWRTRFVLTALIAAALLTYTQSLLNLAILLPLFLLFDVVGDGSAEGRRRQVGLVVAGVAGAVLALGLFYGRYLPTFLDMQKGIAMPEERIVLEKFARQPVIAEETVPEEPDDPFAGPTVDPVRGLRKAGWRLYVFYAWFGPVIAAGIVLLWRGLGGPAARVVAAWALTYVLLNLASGGLPGPNLVRYNKDLEIVAPLFCVALAVVGSWVWERSRLLAAALGGTYTLFTVHRAVRALVERFVLER